MRPLLKPAGFFLLSSILALAVACSSAPTSNSSSSGGEKKRVIPLVGEYQAAEYTLDNGLKLIVVPDHSSPTFAYQTWFGVGSRDEVRGRTGLAHLFEHL